MPFIYAHRQLLSCLGLALAATLAYAEPFALVGSCKQAVPPKLFDWPGKNVLGLGTFILHQGILTNSYPAIFCARLGCQVTNHAFSGGHMRRFEHQADESCRTWRNAPKGLYSTNRELQAKV
jgi:hypothetical protein